MFVVFVVLTNGHLGLSKSLKYYYYYYKNVRNKLRVSKETIKKFRDVLTFVFTKNAIDSLQHRRRKLSVFELGALPLYVIAERI